MYRRSYGRKPLLFAVLLLVAGSLQNFAQADEVNVYSARKEALILPLLERFEAETGIGFNLITAKADELLKRLEAEGRSTPADVFITTDAGRLQRAKDAGVLRAVDNSILNARIPQNLRDHENYWFGLSQRARDLLCEGPRRPG
jgi:iron(III) transport system substrate-binding protein